MKYLKTFETDDFEEGLNDYEWMILEIKHKGSLHIIRTGKVEKYDTTQSTNATVYTSNGDLPYRSSFRLIFGRKYNIYTSNSGMPFKVIHRGGGSFEDIYKIYISKNIEKRFDI